MPRAGLRHLADAVRAGSGAHRHSQSAQSPQQITEITSRFADAMLAMGAEFDKAKVMNELKAYYAESRLGAANSPTAFADLSVAAQERRFKWGRAPAGRVRGAVALHGSPNHDHGCVVRRWGVPRSATGAPPDRRRHGCARRCAASRPSAD